MHWLLDCGFQVDLQDRLGIFDVTCICCWIVDFMWTCKSKFTKKEEIKRERRRQRKREKTVLVLYAQERETDRQTYRQTDRETDRQTDRER